MQAPFELLGILALIIFYALVSWWQNWIQAPRNHMRVKEWKESLRGVILG